MSYNITNYIQTIWTESGNIFIFGTNIQIHFRYICYLDNFSYTYKPNSSKLRKIKLKTTHKFKTKKNNNTQKE